MYIFISILFVITWYNFFSCSRVILIPLFHKFLLSHYYLLSFLHSFVTIFFTSFTIPACWSTGRDTRKVEFTSKVDERKVEFCLPVDIKHSKRWQKRKCICIWYCDCGLLEKNINNSKVFTKPSSGCWGTLAKFVTTTSDFGWE